MLRLYNSLTRKQEPFTPLRKGIVKVYSCGPTVYDYAHIGNFRAFLFADVLCRYLEYKGYRVTQVMNLTDVGHLTQDDLDMQGEDKVEVQARKAHKSPAEIADFYIQAFQQDREELGIRDAEKYPKATDHVEEMIRLIRQLLKKGKAYESNGSVYYSVEAFPTYGKLSGNTLLNLQAGKRIPPHPDKKNPHDFALWIHNPDHLMQWEAPWGKGYPGWHIECSAMSMKYLGESFDIHTGGEDNQFPHHECEIAQSEGATGKPLAKYWLHTKHLLVNNEKMSKSKGNFHTYRDITEKGYSAKAIRLALIAAQYRQQQNFTLEEVKNAQKNIDKLNELIQRLYEAEGKGGPTAAGVVRTAQRQFEHAMDDDLNTPEALAAIFDLSRELNGLLDSNHLSAKDAKDALKRLKKINTVLNILSFEKETVALTSEQKKLLKEREELRGAKKFREADAIRDQLLQEGIQLVDTPDGVKAKKK